MVAQRLVARPKRPSLSRSRPRIICRPPNWIVRGLQQLDRRILRCSRKRCRDALLLNAKHWSALLGLVGTRSTGTRSLIAGTDEFTAILP